MQPSVRRDGTLEEKKRGERKFFAGSTGSKKVWKKREKAGFLKKKKYWVEE